MGPLDAFWHLTNFFGPAVGVGVLAAVLCKLVWWKGLRAVALIHLLQWTLAAGAAASLVGLIAFGRDGRMATYGMLVLACAFAVWWRGLRHIK